MRSWRLAGVGLILLCLSACGGVGAPTAASGSLQATSAPAQANQSCPAAPGPIIGQLVFGEDNNLYAMAEGGSNLTQLTNFDATRWAADPAWSPDGQTLAYTLNAQGSDPDFSWLPESSICGMDRETGAGKLLARSESGRTALAEPAWTADGKALLVTRFEHEFDDKQYIRSAPSVTRYELGDDTGTRLVAEGTAPTARPDGQAFAYVLIDPEIQDFVLMAASTDGQNNRQITAPDRPFGSMFGPRWSPDGRQLVFTASGGPSNDASNDDNLGRTLFERLLGVKVARAHGPPSNLWIVNGDGQGLRQINANVLDDPRAAWSPDGKQIAYVAGLGGVYLIDLASGQEQRISEQGNFGGITWTSR